MESPLETRGDEEGIRTVLAKLSGPVKEFVDDSPADLGEYGLDAPRYRIRVTTAGGEALGLWVGAGAENGFFAKNLSQPLGLHRRLGSRGTARRSRLRPEVQTSPRLREEGRGPRRVRLPGTDRPLRAAGTGVAGRARPAAGERPRARRHPLQHGGAAGRGLPRRRRGFRRLRARAAAGADPGVGRGAARGRPGPRSGAGRPGLRQGSESDLACLVDRETAELLGVDRIFKEQGSSGGG